MPRKEILHLSERSRILTYSPCPFSFLLMLHIMLITFRVSWSKGSIVSGATGSTASGEIARGREGGGCCSVKAVRGYMPNLKTTVEQLFCSSKEQQLIHYQHVPSTNTRQWGLIHFLINFLNWGLTYLLPDEHYYANAKAYGNITLNCLDTVHLMFIPSNCDLFLILVIYNFMIQWLHWLFSNSIMSGYQSYGQ